MESLSTNQKPGFRALDQSEASISGKFLASAKFLLCPWSAIKPIPFKYIAKYADGVQICHWNVTQLKTNFTNRVPLNCHWTVTGMSLNCHWNVTGISLNLNITLQPKSHWTATRMSLGCHSNVTGMSLECLFVSLFVSLFVWLFKWHSVTFECHSTVSGMSLECHST